MSYLETLAKNKFNGDIDKARQWLKDNGKRGGRTGSKHFSKVSKKTLQRYNKKGRFAREQKIKDKTLPADEKATRTYLHEGGEEII